MSISRPNKYERVIVKKKHFEVEPVTTADAAGTVCHIGLVSVHICE